VKGRTPAATLKKAVVLLLDRTVLKGYLNPSTLGRTESVDLLTLDGEHRPTPMEDVKSVYFVRELNDPFEPDRKTFLSRPKLDGLWVRLRFRDEDVIEGVSANNLLELLDTGVHLTPPDLHGNALRLFIPRSALAEMTVLGVVGMARRSPRSTRRMGAIADAQSKLFGE
jgi:hypothetical protein